MKMNKYWKLIATGLVIVLSVGTFYITSALSASDFPDFTLKKESGDESAVQSVVIYGNYQQGPIREDLTITQDGSTYGSELSFIDQINGVYQPQMIRNLINEHRNFMRGKEGSTSAFYEDDRYLAHGDVTYNVIGPTSDFKFTFSLLDKKQKETNSFTLDVPDSENLEHIMVQDVQIVNEQLKLFTRNTAFTNDDRLKEEIHVYTVNPSSTKIIGHETLLSVPDLSKNQYAELNMIEETDVMQSHKYVVFRKVIMKEIKQREGAYSTEEVSDELIAYNVETGEKEVISLPEELQGSVQRRMFDGSSVYSVSNNENSVVLTPYSLEDKTVTDEITVKFRKPGEKMGPPIVRIKDGNLYILPIISDSKKPASLTVVDINTGETLYKGAIVGDNPMDNEDLYLYNMAIQ